jgi:hypothetical protein
LRFLPLRRLPDRAQPLTPRLASPGLRCPLSVSHALRAFLQPLSAGLVSCRSHPWGFAPRGPFPSAERSGPLSPSLPSCGWRIGSFLSPSSCPKQALRFCSLPLRRLHGSSPFAALPHLRAFLPAAVRFPASAVTLPQGSRPLRLFPPQGCPKNSAQALSGAFPLSGFSRNLFLRRSFCWPLRVLRAESFGADSHEPTHPSRGLSPLDFPCSLRVGSSWVTPQRLSGVTTFLHLFFRASALLPELTGRACR